MIKRILTFIVSQSFYRGRAHEFWKLFKTILMANIFVLLILSQTAVFAANIYVPDNYSSIQVAVYETNPGDTIIIRDGIYSENLEIDKSLTIISENGAEKTIVQAANSEYHVFDVIADYVNISGLTIMGARGKRGSIAGINICQFDHCIISDNNISENSYGIVLRYSNNNTITKNNIGWNEYYGIDLTDSNNNIVMENNISTYRSDKISLSFGPSIGLALTRSSGNIICLNNFKNPVKNFYAAWDNEASIWNSTSKITYTYKGKTYTNNLGNYWEDYKGIDAGGDGIGDTPYIINNLNKDRRPLMQPFENYTEGGVSSKEEKITLRPPQISLSEEEWDFGKIKEDERPVHIFTIKNTGGEELIISRVRASCGCTAIMLSSDHIPPGKSAELKTTFNPTGYEGLVKKDIYIESNDPQRPKTKIVVITEVQAVVVPVITDRETLREMIEINLYFSDSQAMYLVSERRKIPKTSTLARHIVNELIKGPAIPDLYPTIPQGTQVNEVYIAGDIVYIDLSEEVFKNHPGSLTENPK